MAFTCPARLYDGIQPTPHQGTATIDGNRFTFQAEGADAPLVVSPKQILRHEAVGAACHIEFKQPTPNAPTLQLIADTPGFEDALHGFLDYTDTRVGAGVGRRMARLPIWGWLVLIAIVLPSVYLAVTRGFVAAHRMVSVEKEAALGEAVFGQFVRRFQVCDDEALRAELQAIVEDLADPDSPYTYRVTVCTEKQPNAFALPGGRIIVFSGLLELGESPDSVIGVLAHEVAHVEQRHSLKQILRTMGVMFFMSAAVGGGFEQLELVETASELAGLLLVLKHSREAEAEADALAVQKLHARKRSVAGFLEFLEAMSAQSGSEQVERAMLWMRSHPVTADRIDALEEARAAETFAPSTWRTSGDAWLTLAAACRAAEDEEEVDPD